MTSDYKYKKIFEPEFKQINPELPSGVGDSPKMYIYNDDIILALNVALATGRPLLVRGPSGTGKSTLAYSVATSMEWRYYYRVINSQTQARDLMWSVDHLRRLSDARTSEGGLSSDYTPYVKPEVLWWAFDPVSAREYEDPFYVNNSPINSNAKKAVVLLDEIDKADPDVPNDLLVPIGTLKFDVKEIERDPVACDKETSPLIIISTNSERELSDAFLRRCVEIRTSFPSKDTLLELGRFHGKNLTEEFLKEIIEVLSEHGNPRISHAEFIDLVTACDELEIAPKSDTWKMIKGFITHRPEHVEE